MGVLCSVSFTVSGAGLQKAAAFAKYCCLRVFIWFPFLCWLVSCWPCNSEIRLPYSANSIRYCYGILHSRSGALIAFGHHRASPQSLRSCANQFSFHNPAPAKEWPTESCRPFDRAKNFSCAATVMRPARNKASRNNTYIGFRGQAIPVSVKGCGAFLSSNSWPEHPRSPQAGSVEPGEIGRKGGTKLQILG